LFVFSNRILWDESNLKYNEEHKTATMKIDEPKTPYHYDDMSDKEDEGKKMEQK